MRSEVLLQVWAVRAAGPAGRKGSVVGFTTGADPARKGRCILHGLDERPRSLRVVCNDPECGKRVGRGDSPCKAHQVLSPNRGGNPCPGEQVANDVRVGESGGPVDAHLVGMARDGHARDERTEKGPVKGERGFRP